VILLACGAELRSEALKLVPGAGPAWLSWFRGLLPVRWSWLSAGGSGLRVAPFPGLVSLRCFAGARKPGSRCARPGGPEIFSPKGAASPRENILARPGRPAGVPRPARRLPPDRREGHRSPGRHRRRPAPPGQRTGE